MVTAIPSLIVGLLAGVYVDRHDRKRILMWTCLVQSVIVGLLAVVIGIDAIAIPGLYGLLLLNAGVKQFFDPAHDSLIPEIASDEELAAANSFLSIASFGSTAIGFAGAGILASIDLRLAFVIDAFSFFVCAVLISLMNRYPMPKPDDDATVGVIVANLKSGLGTLFGTPDPAVAVPGRRLMFFSFGLWNVLLLPMSMRELDATEFEYGLQEGADVGRLRHRLVLHGPVLEQAARDRSGSSLGLVAMGICGIAYAGANSVTVAIVLVTISGFFNSPPSVARSVLLQRNTPRDMRGRVFSAFYVMRDVIFLFGMAGAGLADVVNVRWLIAFSAVLLFGVGRDRPGRAGPRHPVAPRGARPARGGRERTRRWA